MPMGLASEVTLQRAGTHENALVYHERDRVHQTRRPESLYGMVDIFVSPLGYNTWRARDPSHEGNRTIVYTIFSLERLPSDNAYHELQR